MTALIWEVELRGNAFDIQALATGLDASALRIVDGGGEYYVHTPEFDQLHKPEDVRDRAIKLVQILNGAARLIDPNYRNVAVGKVVRIDGSGKRDYFVQDFDNAIVRSQVTLTMVVTQADGRTESIPSPPPSSQLQSVVGTAESDPSVEKALRLFSSAQNWVDLYRIYEVIESDVNGGGKGIITQGWVTRDRINLFRWTVTANHPGATGDAARHGSMATQPPASPMAFVEAQEMIRSLLEKWVETKL